VKSNLPPYASGTICGGDQKNDVLQEIVWEIVLVLKQIADDTAIKKE